MLYVRPELRLPLRIGAVFLTGAGGLAVQYCVSRFLLACFASLAMDPSSALNRQ